MIIGILGCEGSMGRRHVANAKKLGHAVRCYDPKLHGTALRELLIQQSDAVVIASPTEYHLKDLTDVLAAGKHALVEKPIALTKQRKAVQNVIETNRACTVPLTIAVGYNLRFHNLIKETREAMRDIRHAPFWASFTCCQYTESPDACVNGCLETWATHEIDLAQHLIGDLRLIDKHVDRFRVDLGLQKWDGEKCHVHIHSDMRAHQKMREVRIVSDYLTTRLDLERYPVTNDHYLSELNAFVDRCEGIGSDTLASGEDGLSALMLAERAVA